MMASRYIPRTREYRGIQPSSVAVKAKFPLKKPADWLTQKNRSYDDQLRNMQSQVDELKIQDLRADFETNTERRILIGNVKHRVKSLQQAKEYELECRRQRLKDRLKMEELCYLKEMEEKEETVLERQAKMRERAKFLKDKREAERLAVVQEKYDQQFRDQCEELRSTLSKRHQDQVCLERLEQLRQKEETAKQNKIFNDMYAHLWEQDMLSKAAREEREAKEQHERNRGVLEVLRKQMAALDVQKNEAERLKDEEAQLLKEQRALWKLEDAKALEEKRRKQQETRNMLDHSLASKARKKAKEVQEQMAFDLKMLEQLLEESRNEAMETMQRKREMREEDRRYRDYLSKLMEEEKQRERELEQLIQREVEAAWQKRLDQWKRERQARKLLLDDVMQGRAKQLQERLMANELEQMEAAKEKVHLQQRIAENQRLDAEEAGKKWHKNQTYQKDLVNQIGYKTQMREGEKRKEENEFHKEQLAEKEYQARMKEVLDNPSVDHLHPLRKHLLASGRM